MKIKRFLTGILGSMLILFNVHAAFAQQVTGFIDVASSHPNYKAILDLKARGIIGGYPDGTFKPDQTVNRVETLKIILLGLEKNVEISTKTATFTDISLSEWYGKYLNKAVELGIVQGYADGTFKPTQTVNLVENLKILLLTKGIDLATIQVTADPYADTPKTEWYAKYVQYAKDHNLIDADLQNKVFPAQSMTRAKLAEVIYRLLYIEDHNLDSYSPEETDEGETALNVKIEDFAFSPTEMTIGLGTTVRWTNKDAVAHTVTSDTGTALNSELLGNGETFEHTFDQVGTYNYHCTPHPNMKATIIVKPANEVPTI